MKKLAVIPTRIEEYIDSYPPAIQTLLKQMHKTIREAAPGAEESISYQMPAFKLHGPLVYFAAYEKHIGFYPTPSGIENFKEELADYKRSKGAVQFPLDRPLPLKLISKMVRMRVKENEEKESMKVVAKKRNAK
ncbi:MAG: DUF1801 domain-containing protein [Ferruginibacter sp.]|nr:DUF1801 domain-containing protein [Ferruginibacter sp.]